jgi:hypothetical protein
MSSKINNNNETEENSQESISVDLTQYGLPAEYGLEIIRDLIQVLDTVHQGFDNGFEIATSKYHGDKPADVCERYHTCLRDLALTCLSDSYDDVYGYYLTANQTLVFTNSPGTLADELDLADNTVRENMVAPEEAQKRIEREHNKGGL